MVRWIFTEPDGPVPMCAAPERKRRAMSAPTNAVDRMVLRHGIVHGTRVRKWHAIQDGRTLASTDAGNDRNRATQAELAHRGHGDAAFHSGGCGVWRRRVQRMIVEFLIAAGLMGGIGVILAIVLAIADKKFYVWEDPRIDEVESMLPLANCGACGCPGCRAFAEKAVKGEIAPGRCTVNSPAGIRRSRSSLKWMRAGKRSAWRGWPARAVSTWRGRRRITRVSNLPGGGAGFRRRQRLQLGLPGIGGLRAGLRIHRNQHGSERAARGNGKQVHGLRRLRRGLSQRQQYVVV